jgi:hypothetical protein
VERPTADPLADLRGAMRLVANQCGASADLVVMGRSAADAFESNPNVLNAFDKQRINQGVLSASNLSWGVISLGSYRGVTLHVYEAEYQGSDEAIRSRLLRLDRFERGSGLLLVCGNLAGRSGRAHDPRLRGSSHPDDQLRELRGHPEVPTVFASRSRSTESVRVDDPRRSLIFNL